MCGPAWLPYAAKMQKYRKKTCRPRIVPVFYPPQPPTPALPKGGRVKSEDSESSEFSDSSDNSTLHTPHSIILIGISIPRIMVFPIAELPSVS